MAPSRGRRGENEVRRAANETPRDGDGRGRPSDAGPQEADYLMRGGGGGYYDHEASPCDVPCGG